MAFLWASPAAAKDCFSGLLEPLKRAGYSYGLDCKDVVQTIEYVGKTKPRHGQGYMVYLLSYRTTEPGVASHYGQRILIFDAHRRYLGQYHLEAAHRLRIVGSDVLLNVPANHGNCLRLDGSQPPVEAWLDGDVEAWTGDRSGLRMIAADSVVDLGAGFWR
jgi:hypothetical protein